MFDKCVLFNLHASKPVWAGYVSSLYYIIQNIFLCSIIQTFYTFANKIYIHIHTYLNSIVQTVYWMHVNLKGTNLNSIVQTVNLKGTNQGDIVQTVVVCNYVNHTLIILNSKRLPDTLIWNQPLINDTEYRINERSLSI